MHKATNYLWEYFQTIHEKQRYADNEGSIFQIPNLRAYLDTHFGVEKVAPHGLSEKLFLRIFSNDS